LSEAYFYDSLNKLAKHMIQLSNL